MKFRTLDHTGDSVQHADDLSDAKKIFKDLKKANNVLIDGKTQTVMHRFNPNVEEVIVHRPIVGG